MVEPRVNGRFGGGLRSEIEARSDGAGLAEISGLQRRLAHTVVFPAVSALPPQRLVAFAWKQRAL